MRNLKSVRSIDVKESNRISVLKLISQGICSRVEISNILGLSKPAVSSIVEELITEGLVNEKGYGESTAAGGKRRILLKLNEHAGLIIAVYFNEQWYEIALVDLSANIIASMKQQTRICADYRETFDDVINDMQELVQTARSHGVLQPVLACGVAIKGLVHTETGVLQYSAGIPEWSEVHLSDYISNKIKIPVLIENDARAITCAELLFGCGVKGCERALVCVNIEHGIGTGVVIQNEIFRGAFDGAVTFAHTTVVENGPRCSCGNTGCWESLASVSGFLKELGRRNSDYQHLSLQDALRKFHDGDPLVTDTLLNYTGHWLGVGIANILNVFNPERVILHGRITSAGNKLRDKIIEVSMSRTLPVSQKATISFSILPDNSQVIGAAAVVIKQFYSKEHHREIWRVSHNPGEKVVR